MAFRGVCFPVHNVISITTAYGSNFAGAWQNARPLRGLGGLNAGAELRRLAWRRANCLFAARRFRPSSAQPDFDCCPITVGHRQAKGQVQMQRVVLLCPVNLRIRAEQRDVANFSGIEFARESQRGDLRMPRGPSQKNSVDRIACFVAREAHVLFAQGADASALKRSARDSVRSFAVDGPRAGFKDGFAVDPEPRRNLVENGEFPCRRWCRRASRERSG